jgi:2-keto-3-deoxy-L-rhamnonate aldolase RhmA
MAAECIGMGYTLVSVGSEATLLAAAARQMRGELAAVSR